MRMIRAASQSRYKVAIRRTALDKLMAYSLRANVALVEHDAEHFRVIPLDEIRDLRDWRSGDDGVMLMFLNNATDLDYKSIDKNTPCLIRRE